MPKILNVRDIHQGLFGKHAKPTTKTLRDTHAYAAKRNISLAADGRAYIPNSGGTPKGFRWERGRLVRRGVE